MNIVIPMAGKGTRTKELGTVKPLIEIEGIPMIQRSIESMGLSGQYIFITRQYDDRYLNLDLHHLLRKIQRHCKIITINYVTDGPACSALIAKEYINNDTPLVITNPDHIIEWNPYNFIKAINRPDIDGLVTTWDKIDTTESFIELDENGYGKRLVEKEIISDTPLNGVHFWKKGRYFVESAEEMIDANARSGNGEFYISETYNFMIKNGYKIGHYPIVGDEKHWPVGITSDVKKYLERDENSRYK